MHTKTRTIVFMIVILFALASLLSAQDFSAPKPRDSVNVTDQELESFAEAYSVVQEIQQGLNSRVNQLVDSSGIEHDMFQQLYQAHLNNDREPLNRLDEADQQEFLALVDRISSMQQERQTEMVEEIDDHGFSVQEFNTIAAAIQQDSELHGRFIELSQNQAQN